MKTRSSILKILPVIGLLTAVSILCAISPRVLAQDTVIEASFAKPSKEPIPVFVLTGQSCLLVFDKPIGRLAVSNTDTAEAVLVAPDQMSINGKTSGRARFTTWSKDGGQYLFIDVDVRANLAQIDSQVRALFPKEDVRLSQANGSVVISGNADPKVAQQVETVIQAAGFKTVNLLVQPIMAMAQVQLQVRVAEVSRNKLTELAASPVVQTQSGEGGYSNTGLGPYSVNSVTGGDIFGSVASSLNLFVMSNNAFLFLRALQTQGALRALAEPNLIAMNGQQASFLAGGEIPIPFVQSGGGGGSAVSIVFKEYGVRVNFKPTILDEQHIRLELEPEVSTLDYGNAVRLNGFLIPALRVRRAKTGIELQDGQSFGIAGLLDNNEQKALSKIPILADVPILGNLFKSKSFQKNESELVFIVTAKITKPLNPDALPLMKGVDGLKGSSPLGVELPGATGSATTGTGGSATSDVSPVKSDSSMTNGGTDGKNTKSGDGKNTGSAATGGVAVSNFTPAGNNAASNASATSAATTRSASSMTESSASSGPPNNSNAATGDSAAGVKSAETGESEKSSSGATDVNVAKTDSGTTGDNPTSKVAPGEHSATTDATAASGKPASSAAGAISNGGVTGSASLNAAKTAGVEGAAGGKNTANTDLVKSKAAKVNAAPGSGKAVSGGSPSTDKKTRNTGRAGKRAGATENRAVEDDGATRKALTPTKTSSRPIPTRKIKGLTWKIRLPEFSTLTMQQ